VLYGIKHQVYTISYYPKMLCQSVLRDVRVNTLTAFMSRYTLKGKKPLNESNIPVVFAQRNLS